jgi:tellurite resistance protein TehA-like permease
MPFNLGWWGFAFSLAVYALATLALANAMHLAFLSAIGAVLVVGPAAFWPIVAARTGPSGVAQDSLCRALSCGR